MRVTLPDGTVVTSDQPDLAQRLSKALGRDVAFAEARGDGESSGAQAEEYWPIWTGLDYRDTVTEWELPAGTFFDLAVVHMLTTATIERLRALYPDGRFEVRRFRPEHRRLDRARCARVRGERLDRPHRRDRRRGPLADHRRLPSGVRDGPRCRRATCRGIRAFSVPQRNTIRPTWGSTATWSRPGRFGVEIPSRSANRTKVPAKAEEEEVETDRHRCTGDSRRAYLQHRHRRRRFHRPGGSMVETTGSTRILASDEAHHHTAPGFKYLVTEQVGEATGGPQRYTGRAQWKTRIGIS